MKKGLIFSAVLFMSAIGFAQGNLNQLENKILTSPEYAKVQIELAKGLIKVEENMCELSEVMFSKKKYGTLSPSEKIQYKTAIMDCTRLITYKTGGVDESGVEGVNTDSNHYVLLIVLGEGNEIISISYSFPPQAG